MPTNIWMKGFAGFFTLPGVKIWDRLGRYPSRRWCGWVLRSLEHLKGHTPQIGIGKPNPINGQ